MEASSSTTSTRAAFEAHAASIALSSSSRSRRGSRRRRRGRPSSRLPLEAAARRRRRGHRPPDPACPSGPGCSRRDSRPSGGSVLGGGLGAAAGAPGGGLVVVGVPGRGPAARRAQPSSTLPAPTAASSRFAMAARQAAASSSALLPRRSPDRGEAIGGATWPFVGGEAGGLLGRSAAIASPRTGGPGSRTRRRRACGPSCAGRWRSGSRPAGGHQGDGRAADPAAAARATSAVRFFGNMTRGSRGGL